MSFSVRKSLRLLVFGLIIIGIWVAALYFADYVANNSIAQNAINQLGYFGVFAIGLITGFNVFVPVPAPTFVPIFIAAGFWMPLVIIVLVIGTTTADMASYFIGRWSKDFAKDYYPKTYARLLFLDEKHHNLVLPFLFVYAIFSPFPNEAVLIPLAMIGFEFRKLILPVLLGNLIYQTVLSLGVTNIFAFIF